VSAAGGRLAAPPLPDFSKDGEVELVPLNKIARTTIENLTRSWHLIPHVTQQGLADVTELESVRKDYNQRGGETAPKITLTAIAVKASVAVLKEFPRFNSSVDLENHGLIFKRYYHVGVAVDTEHGLLVPVIRDADRKHIADIAAEIEDLARRAKERKLDVKEMQGATFTISNQGGIGGTAFSPIVNWPQVAILGLSRAAKQMVVIGDEPQVRLIVPMSLSYDHRAINGAEAARFIVRLGEILSDSRKLLFET
jgi:pyruvate dehydrogenase E2 component (dihydrolipoamide acetyltransferase)